MYKEAEWLRTKTVPTIDEYMENAYVSFALGPIVLPALYLVGPKLSDEDAESHELNHLYKLMSTCGRVLNDIHSFKVRNTSLLLGYFQVLLWLMFLSLL